MTLTIRSSTAHRFSKDPYTTFLDSTAGEKRDATPSMLVGTFFHAQILGKSEKPFEVSDKATVKIKELDDKFVMKASAYSELMELVNSLKKAIKGVAIVDEILTKGTIEQPLNVCSKEYFQSMGLCLDMESLVIGTPDCFYIKEDCLYILDLKTTSTAEKRGWIYYSLNNGYLNQFNHYKTMLKLLGHEFKTCEFIHVVQSTQSPAKWFCKFGEGVLKTGESKFLSDNKVMCDSINLYGDRFLENYIFDLETLDFAPKKDEEDSEPEAVNEEDFSKII